MPPQQQQRVYKYQSQPGQQQPDSQAKFSNIQQFKADNISRPPRTNPPNIATSSSASVLSLSNPPASEPENAEDKKKPFWKGKVTKVTKAEKIRRRNSRLSKILQPKNAVMILNELARGCTYTVEELPVKIDANQFRSVVSFDNQHFAGTGRTKIAAKNAAAEIALKHIVKTKQFPGVAKKDEDAMDTDEDSQMLPWSHIASFALYKLISSWGEDLNIFNKSMTDGGTVTDQQVGLNTTGVSGGEKVSQEPRPARKMPEHPELVNPVMLVHQMLPHAVWEEVGKSGVAPNIIFTFSVTLGDKVFNGSGPSKKAAKKMAAFSACHEILSVNYPKDVWISPY
ncbi:hypothetical protein ABEB36_008430 [Hypothenemus hampei]